MEKPVLKPAVPPVVIPPQWFISETFLDYGSQSDISGDSELSDRLSVISSLVDHIDGYHYASQSSGNFLDFRSRLSDGPRLEKLKVSIQSNHYSDDDYDQFDSIEGTYAQYLP